MFASTASRPGQYFGLPFLGSDDARYLHGALFTVDGGYMVH